MSAKVEHVNRSWTSLTLAVVLVLGGCGREEPAQIDAAPAVMPAVKTTIESAPAAVETPTAPPSAMMDADTQKQGRVVYVHYCADCHDDGEGRPGTMRLTARMGAEKSVLTTRADLAPEYVKVIVRNGLGMMPAFRPTEVTDADLDALAAYIVNANEDPTVEAQ